MAENSHDSLWLAQYLKEHCAKFDIELGEDEISKFLLYKDLLISWNEKINLTAITDAQEIMLKHFVDSLTILPWFKDNQRVIDVGTGAGFPGIPVKIAQENIVLTLMDSLNKRIKFLDTIVSELSLKNVNLIHSRAEDGGQAPQLREKYDIALSRAVAAMPVLCEYCLPFVKKGGSFIAMKGKMPADELSQAKRAIKLLGGEIDQIKQFSLTEDKNERTIISIKKIRTTPREYPRKAGMPSKSPL